jgi:perosamine synthetase
MPRNIPYGHQSIDEDDINAVVSVLESDWLTTGPKVSEFESAICKQVQSDNAVAVSSGTAALHAAMFALGIKKGDEVIVPAITFAATANCVVYQGGTPVFADVEPDTLLIDCDKVESLITEKTKAIIAVDYAGQPCNYQELETITCAYNLALVADACHSLGGSYMGWNVGWLADISVFSFHPVKGITTGEGGMITTDNKRYAERMKMFRNHGISTDHSQRSQNGTWFYEMTELGYNYRLTDFQCALGMSQLNHLNEWIQKRGTIADKYTAAFKDAQGITPLTVLPDRTHAYHLYVVKVNDRNAVFEQLRSKGIGVNVHYIPVHLHPYYRREFGTHVGQCPVAEEAYEQILSLPIYPGLSDGDLQRVIKTMKEVCT